MEIKVIDITDKQKFIGNAGFVKLVDCMPRVIPQDCTEMMCDYAIVQAARVSLDQGTKTPEQDSKLIDFLIIKLKNVEFVFAKFCRIVHSCVEFHQVLESVLKS